MTAGPGAASPGVGSADGGAATAGGPLQRLRVVELGGIGPGPFAGMMLADMGADVVRVDRIDPDATPGRAARDILLRGRRSVALDLKRPEAVELVLRLAGRADVLIEGFRPGVAERLGLGPGPCQTVNDRLVYARMTGWGQDGPLSAAPGHDINYIAVAGALAHIGRRDGPPVPPLNLVGDYGGGGMLLTVGVLAALFERQYSGRGQVVDASMVDGVALLMASMHGGRIGPRGTRMLDSGAPYYDVYECADGEFVSVGALEPAFYAELRRVLGLGPVSYDYRAPGTWDQQRAEFARVFATRTRDQWCAAFDGVEACVAPVLSRDEAHQHPHNVHRGTFVDLGGIVQPAPAPRFSRSPAHLTLPPRVAGADSPAVLAELGLDLAQIARLVEQGIAAGPLPAGTGGGP